MLNLIETPSTIKVSACGAQKCSNLRFEYGVILNGSQTSAQIVRLVLRFEYGVILNGSQTVRTLTRKRRMFEYGVILNGSQTFCAGEL